MTPRYEIRNDDWPGQRGERWNSLETARLKLAQLQPGGKWYTPGSGRWYIWDRPNRKEVT
jgi:hypothetical protein